MEAHNGHCILNAAETTMRVPNHYAKFVVHRRANQYGEIETWWEAVSSDTYMPSGTHFTRDMCGIEIDRVYV